MISLFNTIAVGIINIITYDIGLSLDKTLERIGINFIKFGKTTLEPHTKYFLFYTSLEFHLENFAPSWA